jgi:hypothetical protein
MTTNKKSNVISIGDHIYPLDKTLSVPYDFGFNLLHSASKLKRGIIEKTWWVLLVFRIREFFFPQYVCCFVFFCRES